MGSLILLGADPELFITKSGVPVGALGLIKGNKEHPFPVNKGAVQVDGMAAEFNIDPAASSDEWVGNIQAVLEQLQDMLPETHKLEVLPTVEFGESLKEYPPEATELGCNPDYNAWLYGSPNDKPNAEVTFRTASGHVHVGVGELSMMEMLGLVKQFDFYLGLSSLAWDEDTKRRSLYGKAGCFRPKPYGFEYRTLSNAWLKSEELMRKVYELSMRAVNDFQAGIKPYLAYEDVLEDIINNSNKEEGLSLLRAEGLL